MRPARWVRRKIIVYLKSDLDLLSYETTNRHCVWENDIGSHQFLYVEAQGPKAVNKIFSRHVTSYDTGVGPVAIEMNFICSCMRMASFGSF
jgi:hypothetical protein